jgi:hypothetical protein
MRWRTYLISIFSLRDHGSFRMLKYRWLNLLCHAEFILMDGRNLRWLTSLRSLRTLSVIIGLELIIFINVIWKIHSWSLHLKTHSHRLWWFWIRCWLKFLMIDGFLLWALNLLSRLNCRFHIVSSWFC